MPMMLDLISPQTLGDAHDAGLCMVGAGCLRSSICATFAGF